MTEPFAPSNGVQPQWRYAYDLVAGLAPGDEVTYLALAEALDWEFEIKDDAMRRKLCGVMRLATIHLEKDGQRTVKTVAMFGWVVQNAKGNIVLVDQRTRKVRRGVNRTVTLIQATDVTELDQRDRQRLDFQRGQLSRTQEMLGRTARLTADKIAAMIEPLNPQEKHR